eukprot:CAMPEP_0185023134 /NCGR_PEP_ID=MMETSP1103-20130426/5819_1 /TAXON_ID=36769 /ORGANISM="Paraphysomonas bandaiensis, Strain Caron Lab Isolate" /LENGTH=194 /DNA_ID=CAMNT_0027555571 /DNA_START=268 /DNA_END=852 /DNA_ORIENTATION=+
MRQEYSAAGLSRHLWWTRKDFLAFRQKGSICDDKDSKPPSPAHMTDVPPQSRVPTLSSQLDRILIVSDSADMRKSLVSKLSTIVPKSANFVSCCHSEVASMHAGNHSYSAVVVDGTQKIVDDTTLAPPACVVTAHLARALSPNTKITVFVEDESVSKGPIAALCAEGNVALSDMMVLTLDCWREFQSLVNRAGT